MKVIGISCSGRSRTTHDVVSAMMKGMEEFETEYISLQGKQILPCDGCVKCAKDFVCKIDDDWKSISEKVLEADGVIIGVPNYYGTANSLSHAFMERFFAFRHKNEVKLKGKKIAVATIGGFDQNAPLDICKNWIKTHEMELASHVSIKGQVPCAVCGLSDSCEIGYLGAGGDENKQCSVTREMFMSIESQPEKFAAILAAGRDLGNAIRKK